MTRKDYELIAGALKQVPETTASYNPCTHATAAHNIAQALQADNPRFDREKFLKACGID